MFISILCPY